MLSIDVVTIFLTGLFAGGISCMVLQGGLFTAAVSGSALRENAQENVRPVIIFLVAKVIAYTALGYFLGWVGSFFTISISLQIFLQSMVILFMMMTILSMVTDHPLFFYFSLRAPTKILSILASSSRQKHTWFYALLGGLTVLLPCGVTQAMMALAVGTGSPVSGAMVLFAYSLGTTPVFFALGAMIVRLTSTLKTKFSYVAALGVFVLVVANVNDTLSLAANGLTLQKNCRKYLLYF
jgi:sulfite exporter TauE/SafE